MEADFFLAICFFFQKSLDQDWFKINKPWELTVHYPRHFWVDDFLIFHIPPGGICFLVSWRIFRTDPFPNRSRVKKPIGEGLRRDRSRRSIAGGLKPQTIGGAPELYHHVPRCADFGCFVVRMRKASGLNAVAGGSMMSILVCSLCWFLILKHQSSLSELLRKVKAKRRPESLWQSQDSQIFPIL